MTSKFTSLRLTNYSILEPEGDFLPFFPSWYNTHEASMFKKANKLARVDSWLFKRFGVDKSVLIQERVRKTSYREWINTLNQTCLNISKQLGPKELFKLNQEKTALFYIDSWGETSPLENVNSWRDSLTIDILPKAIVKQFQIKDITSKIRGERNALLLAFLAAQDIMSSTDYDNVIICGQYRAYPIHVFSELTYAKRIASNDFMTNNSQEVVERVCCFLFRKNETQTPKIDINLESYTLLSSKTKENLNNLSEAISNVQDLEGVLITHPPMAAHKMFVDQLKKRVLKKNALEFVVINQLYADSGCLSVACALEYFSENSHKFKKALILAFDNEGGVWKLTLQKNQNTDLSGVEVDITDAI